MGMGDAQASSRASIRVLIGDGGDALRPRARGAMRQATVSSRGPSTLHLTAQPRAKAALTHTRACEQLRIGGK